jgi:hypothetical protein
VSTVLAARPPNATSPPPRSIDGNRLKSRMFFDAIPPSYDVGPDELITMKNFFYLFGGTVPGASERIESSFTFVDTSSIFDVSDLFRRLP